MPKNPNKDTKAQTEAVKRRAAFAKNILKALGARPIAMRQIAAKLGLADATGAVKPSNAAKIRKVLTGLIKVGDVERVGNSLRSTAYKKVKK
jgi:hypothetical protein